MLALERQHEIQENDISAIDLDFGPQIDAHMFSQNHLRGLLALSRGPCKSHPRAAKRLHEFLRTLKGLPGAI